MSTRTVLVTGAARGIGRATAVRLARSGWRVYGGVRTDVAAKELAAEPDMVTPVELDLTVPERLATLDRELPVRLDVFVNSGIGVADPLETMCWPRHAPPVRREPGRAAGGLESGHRGPSQVRSRRMTARRAVIFAVAFVSVLWLSPAAEAHSPARDRELTCADGTVFIAEQVRHGSGRPPSVWRGITPGGDPVAFVFRAVTLTAPDGTVDETETWDNAAGVRLNHELTTCSFVIPVGPLTGYRADFVGYFVPVRD